ncbi:MAG: hypothetical protein ACM3YN_01000 [Parcubacteria group bacterium]
MGTVKGVAALLVTAGVFFLLGFSYGERSVPKTERYWQGIIDDCHRFLEVGLDADFGRCVAGAPPRAR